MTEPGSEESDAASECRTQERLIADGGESEEDGENDTEQEEEEGVTEGSEGESEEREADEEGDEEADEEGDEEADEEGDEDGTDILALDLEGLYVNLLGVEIDLNEVVLDVSAVPGSGNLLGNLLSPILGLLDNGIGSRLKDMLPEVGLPSVSSLAPEGGFPSPIERLRGAASRLWGVLTAPGRWMKGKLESDEEDDETGLVDDLRPEGGLPSLPSLPSFPSLPSVSNLFYRLLNVTLDGVLAVLAESEDDGEDESEDEESEDSGEGDGSDGQ